MEAPDGPRLRNPRPTKAKPWHECNVCRSCFVTRPELEAHKRSHLPSTNGHLKKVPNGGSNGLKVAQLKTALEQAQDETAELQRSMIRTQGALESVQRKMAQVAADNELLRDELSGRVAEQERQQRQAALELDAISAVACFTDEDLEALGISREEAVARAVQVQTPVETPGLRRLLEKAINPNRGWDPSALVGQKVTLTDHQQRTMQAMVDQQIVNGVVGQTKSSAGTHDSGAAMDISATPRKASKQMRGMRSTALVVDEGMEFREDVSLQSDGPGQVTARVMKDRDPKGQVSLRVMVDPDSYAILREDARAAKALAEQIQGRM